MDNVLQCYPDVYVTEVHAVHLVYAFIIDLLSNPKLFGNEDQALIF